ncbi:Protein N-acetyltransferase, RimJ/RimL family [Actinopolyspora alba]|uniref:Protein N-acetyltransferase, RimJ/RimL family n=1 Tax=Actinopolyspora alba TaxID=673379 RepID=A0A1I1UFE0_9ACTN|nr:Protein N-acetyltransferase, RimJ/RimL family [Actinopolyspora alba]
MGVSALPFPDPPLSDDAVALRSWTTSDARQWFDGFSDPLCLQFSWPLVEPFTIAHVQQDMVEHEKMRLRGEAINFAVVEATDHELVLGGASIYEVALDQGRAAAGYWLAPHARGRGLATRTLRLLAHWVFDHLELERLELTCAPDNIASQRVAERCGFTREGVLRSRIRFQGGRRDSMMFSLLADETR